MIDEIDEEKYDLKKKYKFLSNKFTSYRWTTNLVK